MDPRLAYSLLSSYGFLRFLGGNSALEGLTFFFQRNYTGCMPLESSCLAELNYSISAGQDVRLKNYDIRKL